MPTYTLDGTKRPSFAGGPLWDISLCAGIVFALVVFGLLRYACDRELHEQARGRALDSLELVESIIDGSWGKTSILAEHIARQLNVTDKARIPGILSQYKSLRPDAGFSVFDHNGDFLFLPLAEGELAPHAAPLLHTVRTMVHQALVGKIVRGFTQLRGFLSMSIAVPVRSGAAGAFVVALPLDSLLLQDMKELSRVEIAIFPFADDNARVSGGVGAAVGTFAKSPIYGNFWPDIGDALSGRVLVAPETMALGNDTLYVAMGPLAGPDGEPVGVLVAAPALPGDSAYPVWHLAASLLAGLAAALLCAYCLRRRSQTILVSLAGEINALADGAFLPQGARRGNDWPSHLEDAFARLTTTLRRYSARARKAEREQLSMREREEEPEKGVRVDGDFLRLFSSAPVGIFLIEESGIFSVSTRPSHRFSATIPPACSWLNVRPFPNSSSTAMKSAIPSPP